MLSACYLSFQLSSFRLCLAEEHFIADEDTDVSYKQALREYDLLCLCNVFNTLST